MSTNKTKNYALHAWELEDDFLLSEINENFAALDAGAVQILFGTYAGDGTKERFIDLGFTPLALLVSNGNGVFDTSYTYYGGLTLRGYPSIYSSTTKLLEIVEGGFRVYKDSGGSPSNASNHKAEKYYYLAFY